MLMKSSFQTRLSVSMPLSISNSRFNAETRGLYFTAALQTVKNIPADPHLLGEAAPFVYPTLNNHARNKSRNP